MQGLVLAQGVLLMALLAVVGPFVSIWSLNMLFPSLHIAYDFWSWLAMVWLHSAIIGRGIARRA